MKMREIKIYNTLQVTIQSESCDWTESAEAYADEINKAIAYEEINLADEYHGATYYKKLHSIKMGTEFYGDKLYGLAICEIDDDWNDEDTKQLKEYLTRQYSDGWGEGFEQREIAEWTEEEECEEYDEEENEYYTDYYNATYCTYVTFWKFQNNDRRRIEILIKSHLKKKKGGLNYVSESLRIVFKFYTINYS